METTDTNMVQAVYTYGRDLISAQIGEIRGYYHYDGLGTVKQLTDDSGTVTKSYTYDSFGNVIASTGTSVNTYGFTGEQQFGEADSLVFLRARYYEPSIGRFISPDTFGMIPQGKKRNWFSPFLRYTDGMNLYVYVRNNPIMNTDYMGLSCCFSECMSEMGPGIYEGLVACLESAGIGTAAGAATCVIGCLGTGPGYPACVGACFSAVGIIGGIEGAACAIGAAAAYAGAAIGCAAGCAGL